MLKTFFILLLPVFAFSWNSNEVLFESVEKDIPIVLWWSENFFPHVEEAGKYTEVECSSSGLKCLVTQNKSVLKTINDDRIVSLMFYGSNFDVEDIPLPKKDNHLWALFNEESPKNSYLLTHNVSATVFNFSATYKRNSDFPLTLQHYPSKSYLLDQIPVSIIEKNKYRKEGLAPIAYLQSHCDAPSDRDAYVKELMKYIDIDSYGSCLNNKQFKNTSLHDTSEMHNEEVYEILSKYKFHIAFENAICDDYITEKLTRAFHLGSVPVYRGSKFVRDFAPSENSVILAEDFSSPRILAKYLKMLDKSDAAYLKHLDYKKSPEIPNKFLESLLNDRQWDPNGYDESYMVGSYECYICDKMHAIKNERKQGIYKSYIVDEKDITCPKPQPSLGKIEDLPPNNHMHMWIESYWHQLDMARALKEMVSDSKKEATSFSSIWGYIEKLYEQGNGAYSHTEL